MLDKRVLPIASPLAALLVIAQAAAQDRDPNREDCADPAVDCEPAATETRTSTGEADAGLERITVTATRRPEAPASVPQKITVIDAKAIEQQQSVSVNLVDTLSNLIPSFSPSRQKMTGFGEAFRGREALFLIDGVPQTNPLRNSSRDGVTIDREVIERIEVVHGANAIQGLGASGGIVNLITASPEQSGEWLNRFSTTLTSADDLDDDGFGWRGHYLTSKRSGAFDFTAAVSYETRELFFDGNDNPVGIDNTQGDLADSDQRNFFLKLGYRPGTDQRIQFTINDFKIAQDGDFRDVPGDRAAGIPATTVPGTPDGEPPENDVTTASLDYTHEALLGGRLSVQFYYQDFAAVFGGDTFGIFQDPSIAPVGELFDQSSNEAEKLGSRVTYSRNELFDAPVDFITGIDLLRDRTKQVLINSGREWVPETDFNNVAPFVQLDVRPLAAAGFSGLEISGGVRYEYAELEVDDFETIAGNRDDLVRTPVSGGSPSFDEPLFNIGAVIEPPIPGASLYATFSEGFSMPDVGRVLRGISEPGRDVDDFLNLEPIVTDNLEFGARYAAGPVSAQFSYFESDAGLGSRLVPNTDDIFNVTRQKTKVDGIEFNAEAALGERFDLGLAVVHQDGRFDSDGDNVVDSDLSAADIGPDRLNYWLAFRPTHWLDGRLQFSTLFDKDFRDAEGNVSAEFEGHTLADLFLSSQHGAVNVSLGIQNLFDKQFITFFSQAATSRDDRFFAGIGRRFSLRLSTEL